MAEWLEPSYAYVFYMYAHVNMYLYIRIYIKLPYLEESPLKVVEMQNTPSDGRLQIICCSKKMFPHWTFQ